MAYSTKVFITTTGASTFSVPADFNAADNRITCLGSGGSGGIKRSGTLGGNGGGGGACAFSTNVPLTPGATVDVQVGAGGGTSQTWIKDGIGGTVKVQADFGTTPGTGAAGGPGGLAANCVGGTSFAGGAGRTSSIGSTGKSGGGAAGLSGAGASSGSALGGTADNGTVAGGAQDGAGNNGTEWDATHGSGSGAGTTNVSTNGLAGGNYGGGGGGSSTAGTAGGVGGPGLIVIEYNVAASAFNPYFYRMLAGIGNVVSILSLPCGYPLGGLQQGLMIPHRTDSYYV